MIDKSYLFLCIIHICAATREDLKTAIRQATKMVRNCRNSTAVVCFDCLALSMRQDWTMILPVSISISYSLTLLPITNASFSTTLQMVLLAWLLKLMFIKICWNVLLFRYFQMWPSVARGSHATFSTQVFCENLRTARWIRRLMVRPGTLRGWGASKQRGVVRVRQGVNHADQQQVWVAGRVKDELGGIWGDMGSAASLLMEAGFRLSEKLCGTCVEGPRGCLTVPCSARARLDSLYSFILYGHLLGRYLVCFCLCQIPC